MFALGVALVLAMTAPASTSVAATGASDLTFETHEIIIGTAAHQTVLSGSFLGSSAADVVVVSRDQAGETRVRAFPFTGDTWRPSPSVTLDPGLLFVDLVATADGDRLLLGRGTHLSWLDPATGREHKVIDVRTGFRLENGSGVPHVDITRDLDGDGLDDLVVPSTEGFWIATQRPDGSFREPVMLGPPEPFLDATIADRDRSYREVGITAMTVPWYLGRVHQLDYDGDGRPDLAFWNEDRFDVHLQGAPGAFDPTPLAFVPEVAFDSDGIYSRMFDYSDQGALALLFGGGEESERTVLHSLRDLNGDDVPDLITLTLSGRSLMRQRSVYRIHFGARSTTGLQFSRDADSTLHPRGKAGALEPWGYAAQRFEDFDADGQLDILFQQVKVGAGGMMRALFGHSVPLDLELYILRDGGYRDTPTARFEIRRFSPFEKPGHVFFPAVLVGDVDGDEQPDLLVGHSPEALHLFRGGSGPTHLPEEPRRVAVNLPDDERNTWLWDMDGDGRQDILIHHPAPGKPHRVTILLAKHDSRNR